MASAREIARLSAISLDNVEGPEVDGIPPPGSRWKNDDCSEWTSMEMLRFGDVALDVDRALLRDGNGTEIALRPKSLDLLLTLARNSGRVMSRDELFDAVWPDVTVTEDSIAQCVREVRRAIGDSEGRVLRTIVKRGYCLDVAVQSTVSTVPPERALDVPADQGRPSLVVLPFQSIPYDPDSEWFADGIVEEITTALSRFRTLFVIARNSAFTFKGQSVDVRDVGKRLGVRYVLEGSVRRAGGELRVTGQLIGRCSSAPDHAPGVRLRHWGVGKGHGVVPWAGAKEPALAIVGDAGGVDVSPQHLRKRVVTRHRVLLAAFLVKLHLPACALWPKILDPHAQRRGDARK
jgi:TolB-like protein